jgi:dephospho-CoA kinase
MTLIGLTGGIGMGKSTAARLLEQRGLPVVDTDELAREVVEPGQPALEEVRQAFGAGVIGCDGRLRRDEMARRVFSDDSLRRQLEAILHPRIRQRWRATADTWRAAGLSRGVVVIPLLFETQAERDVDVVLCVACGSATQRQRLAARGWTNAEIDQRLRAQWPVERKMAAADFVIWSEGSLGLHALQMDRILQQLA